MATNKRNVRMTDETSHGQVRRTQSCSDSVQENVRKEKLRTDPTDVGTTSRLSGIADQHLEVSNTSERKDICVQKIESGLSGTESQYTITFEPRKDNIASASLSSKYESSENTQLALQHNIEQIKSLKCNFFLGNQKSVSNSLKNNTGKLEPCSFSSFKSCLSNTDSLLEQYIREQIFPFTTHLQFSPKGKELTQESKPGTSTSGQEDTLAQNVQVSSQEPSSAAQSYATDIGEDVEGVPVRLSSGPLPGEGTSNNPYDLPPTYSSIVHMQDEVVDGTNTFENSPLNLVLTRYGDVRPSPPFIYRIPPPSYAESELMYFDMSLPSMPVTSPFWGPRPLATVCPVCGTFSITRTRYKISRSTHILACFLCVCLCWPCCLLPYCTSACKSTEHYCTSCHSLLGTYRPL